MTSERTPKVRLATAFVVSATLVALLVVGLVVVTFDGWRRSILDGSTTLRDETARRVADHVQNELSVARDVLDDVETGVRLGAIPLDDPRAEEGALFRAVVDHPRLSEVTITRGKRVGFDANDDPILDPDGRSQMSVVRIDGAVITRLVLQEAGGFVAEERRRRAASDALLGAPFVVVGAADDPTTHATFEVPASKPFDGRVLSSDLHWAEMDAKAPMDRRRVVVSVQKALAAADGVPRRAARLHVHRGARRHRARGGERRGAHLRPRRSRRADHPYFPERSASSGG